MSLFESPSANRMKPLKRQPLPYCGLMAGMAVLCHRKKMKLRLERRFRYRLKVSCLTYCQHTGTCRL